MNHSVNICTRKRKKGITIQCEMCEHNIESALNDVDGVKKY
jgi:copper chaperone CopZ